MEPRIHWLGISPSDAIAAKIVQRAEGLSRQAEGIQRIDVWVDALRGHHHKGDLYAVRLRLKAPGGEIAVDSQPREDDVYVSIRQAFDAARRKLEDLERRRRADVKAHPRARGDAARRRLIPASRERDRA